MAMIFIILVVLLLLMSGFTILLNLSSTGNVLTDVSRELEELARNLEPRSSEEYSPENLQQIPGLHPNRDELINNPKQDDGARKPGAASFETEGLKRNVLTKLNDYLTVRKAKTAAGRKNGEFTSSLLNNSGLKKRILDLISKTDEPISLQYLVKHLSRRFFNGNYHPVLNELDQLEREGEIEGRVINGKVLFKKRQKETRKYILRKGKNFQKYMG